jgi:hypothetical protein
MSLHDSARAALADLEPDDPIVLEVRRRLIEAIETAIACADLLGIPTDETTAPWRLRADAWLHRVDRDLGGAV